MKKSRTIVAKIPQTFIDEEDFVLDCPQYPFVPTILPAKKRVIAIGDIHGDLELAIDSFKLAGLIDNSFNWIAIPSDTIVIQVGDQVDSCRPIPGKNACNKAYGNNITKIRNDAPDDVKVIDFFNKMHMTASRHGGAVYSLLGNHELMNADGDFRYVSNSNYENFEYVSEGKKYLGSVGRKDSFKPGGALSGNLACTRNSVMIIGSNMFIHAGVLPPLINSIKGANLGSDSHVHLKYLNSLVRKWLLNKISDKNSDLQTILHDPNLSPFWNRIFGQIKPETPDNIRECDSVVRETLKVFKIGNIVVGHTPQLWINGVGINGTCYGNNNVADNKVWRIDGGFSKAFDVFGSNSSDGKLQVLEILDDNKFNILSAKM